MGIKDKLKRNKERDLPDASLSVNPDFAGLSSASASASAAYAPAAAGAGDGRKKKRGLKGLNPLKRLRRSAKDDPAEGSVGWDGSVSPEYSFNANVRSSEPILKLNEAELAGGWKSSLLLNIACGLLVNAFIALFCMAAEMPGLIPFTLPCLVIFIAMTTVESIVPGKVKWIIAAVVTVILIVTAAVWHTRVFGGLAFVINTFYGIAEEAQAYIYDKFLIGDSATETDCRIGTIWISFAAGMLAALPPAAFRRSVGILVAVIAMLAFAYYGLIPSWICVGVLLAALILTSARGSILSILPVLLASLMLFGLVVLIDPGEAGAISRADENFRDRFALITNYIESEYMGYDQTDSYEDWSDESWEDQSGEDPAVDPGYAPYFIAGMIFLILAAAAAGAILYYKRLSKRRAALMAGIDSPDARTAVVSMFPYSVRWIRGFGINPEAATLAAMLPSIKGEFPDNYLKRYSDMYGVWSEAAYSEHPVTEENRRDMENFMKDTIERIEEKCTFRDKLRLAVRHSLWQGKSSSGEKKRRSKKEKKRAEEDRDIV